MSQATDRVMPIAPAPGLGLKKHPGRIVAAFVAAAFAAGTIAPNFPITLPADLIEGFLWGRSFELGYHKHPPLQAWLLGSIERLAPGQWWIAFVLGQVCVAITIWAVWRLARSLLGEVQGAIAAVLTLAGIFYYGEPSATLTPDTLSLPLWALILLHYWRAVGERRPLYWYALAIDIALFIYSKYVGALLVAVLALLTVATPEGRAALRNSAPWLAGLLCLALASPHLIWLLHHSFVLDYPLEFRLTADSWMQRGEFAGKFFVAQLLNHMGLVALLALLLLPGRGEPQVVAEQPKRDRFATTFVVTASLLPLAIMLVLNLWSGVQFRHAWGSPLFALSAVFALVMIGPQLRLRRLGSAAALAFGLVTVPHLVNGLIPYLRDVPQWRAYPAPTAAKLLTAEFRRRTGQPLRIVVGERQYAGSVALYSSDAPLLFIDTEYAKAPWITPEMLREYGALVVWPSNQYADILQHYRDTIGPFDKQGDVTLAWGNRARSPLFELDWSIIPAKP